MTMIRTVRTCALALLFVAVGSLPGHAQPPPPQLAVPLPAVQPLFMLPLLPAYQPALQALSGTAAAGLTVTTTTTTGSSLLLTNNALTTGTGFELSHTTSVVADGGSLARLSSTSVDTGGSTHGALLDVSATGSVAAGLVRIAASNASQTTETALSIVQSGTTTGYTGNFVSLTGSSTTGAGNLLALTSVNTTGGSAESITANSATTSTAGVLALSATALTSGTVLKIISSAPATMTSGGSFIRVNDGTTDVFRVGQNGVLIFSQTTVPTVASTGDSSSGGCSGCTDTRGVATDTTAANTNAIVITFNTTRTPVACTISPGNAATAVDLKAAGGGILTLGAGTLSISSPSANWAANAKSILYHCDY
jgi:hypothetical protein